MTVKTEYMQNKMDRVRIFLSINWVQQQKDIASMAEGTEVIADKNISER